MNTWRGLVEPSVSYTALYYNINSGEINMERDVILYIAASLDGYLADPEGKVDWLKGHGQEEGEDPGYLELAEQVDTVIMGRTTYEQVVKELSPDKWPYEGMDCYVVTSQFLEDTENVTFWPGDITELVYLLKQQPGKSIWLLGGARLLKNFMEQELVDQYWISTIPAILGQGIRLFMPGDYHQRLIYSRSFVHDGIITSVYYNRA